MATSGNTIKQYTRDDLIKAALRKLAALAKGQSPDTDDYNDASIALNMVVAHLKTKGLQLWLRNEYSFTPTVNVSNYNIGVGQTLNTPYPLKLIQAYRVDTNNTTRVPMEIVPNFDFNRFPTNSSSYPIQITYQPLVNSGVIKLWPTPDSVAATSSVTIIYTRPIEYFDSSTDTMDMPEEWYLPVVYELAKVLAPEWSIPVQERQMLAAEAKQYIEAVEAFGAEDTSVYFTIDRR